MDRNACRLLPLEGGSELAPLLQVVPDAHRALRAGGGDREGAVRGQVEGGDGPGVEATAEQLADGGLLLLLLGGREAGQRHVADVAVEEAEEEPLLAQAAGHVEAPDGRGPLPHLDRAHVLERAGGGLEVLVHGLAPGALPERERGLVAAEEEAVLVAPDAARHGPAHGRPEGRLDGAQDVGRLAAPEGGDDDHGALRRAGGQRAVGRQEPGVVAEDGHGRLQVLALRELLEQAQLRHLVLGGGLLAAHPRARPGARLGARVRGDAVLDRLDGLLRLHLLHGRRVDGPEPDEVGAGRRCEAAALERREGDAVGGARELAAAHHVVPPPVDHDDHRVLLRRRGRRGEDEEPEPLVGREGDRGEDAEDAAQLR
mmetsp:Transcript_71610/g.210279  ORF Transcript_71610/g.210279 Transcript_71610/m.210279 type:complete len:371 (+) Transcript_71610:2740-3852(+)